MDDAVLTIGQLAKRFGLKASAIRYYERIGVLPEPERTLRVTRNVRTGRVGDYLFGGLNYQIEHHLKPGLPRHALRETAARTRARFRAQGHTYHETDWRAAMRAVFAQLHAVGRALGPAPERRPHAAP